MAGTTIKGVGNSGNVQIPDMVTAAKQNAGTSFQAVWNKTQSNAQTTNAADGDRTQAGRNDVRRGESLRAGGRQRNNVADVSDGNKTMEDDSLDAKDLEKVQEVVGTVVQNLIQQITDTFSVSEEELQATMEDLGMTEVDLTDPGKLNELLMAVSGAQDSFALLTDENLYNDVKGIMDLQKELTGQAQEELQLSPEKWQEAVTQITQETVAEPVITVETDKTENVAVTTEESTVDTTEATVTQVPDSGEKVPVQNAQENKTEDSGSRQEHNDGGQHGNLLLQNLKEDNFLAQLQIMDYMKVSVKADSSELEMQLHPQSLGTLHIQMASRNGVVTANFIAQNETVKAALESQMVQLKENFAEQGVKVEAIEVTVQTHQFEQNLEQGRGNNSNTANETGAGRKRTRRINLNAAFAEEEPQTEEDRIAADMMSANGNTVDFTA